jgi:hypothetical protein
MARLLRGLSAVALVAALAGIACLLTGDAWNRLRFTSAHQTAGALSLMLIGLSYIGLQLSAARPRKEMIKGVLLGIAFVLWGGEQFVPPGRFVTLMDSAVVTIFVIDLGAIIVEHLKRRDHELP